ncbi:hypothetical protein [Marinomonas shanghaiensis]|uniref:hypothetical protein n=1 Tax=Marinomonas shanghaiensis TaxID=2202418 RepID=UPI003A8CB563
MKYSIALLCAVSLVANAQTIERQPVDIIYGNQVIRTQHQVVVSSKEEVAVIPAEKAIGALGPNVVITADGQGLSYLEENAIAEREQAIYDEVNKRTEEAPFTVLFTGTIPEEIQEKRLRMMPEIGIFGDQVEPKVQPEDGSAPNAGDFSPIGKGVSSGQPNVPDQSNGAKSAPATDKERLEQLIGG